MTVQNDYKRSFKREKKKNFAVVLTACFLCMAALMVGWATIKDDNKNETETTKNHINLNENPETESSENDLAVDGQVHKYDDESKTTDSNPLPENTVSVNQSETPNIEEESSTENIAGSIIETPEHSVTNGNTSMLSFDDTSKLNWPVAGNIILDYSMENTIYFPTLDSYKCNPAIIIQSDVGTSVQSGATGIVNEISSNDELGNYVVLDLGGAYSLTFGQLDNIELSVGEMVNPDTIIGEIAEPTRYYSNEGPNLYYMITKNEEPCNPIDFLS